MKRDCWNRCTDCGRFVAYSDFTKGLANVHIEYCYGLDAAYDERTIVLCPKHYAELKETLRRN